MIKLMLRSIIVLNLSATNMALASEVTKWDWEKIDMLESKLEKWSLETGADDLLIIGKMKQRPEEAELIEDLFPLLLPNGYFGKSIATTCTPEFEKFRKDKTLPTWDKWNKCLKPLYPGNKPKWVEKALNDLKPETKSDSIQDR